MNNRWHTWFAWYPVWTDDCRVAFLRTIWRRRRERDVFGSLEFPPSDYEKCYGVPMWELRWRGVSESVK